MAVDPDVLREALASLVTLAGEAGEYREHARRCDSEGWYASAKRSLLKETDIRHQVMHKTEEIVFLCTK